MFIEKYRNMIVNDISGFMVGGLLFACIVAAIFVGFKFYKKNKSKASSDGTIQKEDEEVPKYNYVATPELSSAPINQTLEIQTQTLEEAAKEKAEANVATDGNKPPESKAPQTMQALANQENMENIPSLGDSPDPQSERDQHVKICPSCGSQIDINNVSCPVCGSQQ